MGQMITLIHNIAISQQINARHMLSGQVSGYRHPVEDVMFESLKASAKNISLHWGVYESGKSNAALNAAIRLQEEGRLVILLHGYDHSYGQTMREWLRISIGIPDNDGLAVYFNRPTSIIIDNFEFLMRKYDNCKEALKELDTNVLLIVSSWEKALELKNDGCKLIGSAGFGRWKEDELQSLFFTLPYNIQNSWIRDKRELFRLSVLSGTPGYLISSAHSKPCARQAELLDEEWKIGISALEKEDSNGLNWDFI